MTHKDGTFYAPDDEFTQVQLLEIVPGISQILSPKLLFHRLERAVSIITLPSSSRMTARNELNYRYASLWPLAIDEAIATDGVCGLLLLYLASVWCSLGLTDYTHLSMLYYYLSAGSSGNS